MSFHTASGSGYESMCLEYKLLFCFSCICFVLDLISRSSFKLCLTVHFRPVAVVNDFEIIHFQGNGKVCVAYMRVCVCILRKMLIRQSRVVISERERERERPWLGPVQELAVASRLASSCVCVYMSGSALFFCCQQPGISGSL